VPCPGAAQARLLETSYAEGEFRPDLLREKVMIDIQIARIFARVGIDADASDVAPALRAEKI